MKIFILSGYANIPKIEVEIDNKTYILELKDAETILLEALKERGYTISQTKRQKYPRININK